MSTKAAALVIAPGALPSGGTAAPALSVEAEWRVHWPLVLAAMGGMSFASVAASTIGLFMEPLGKEFGLGRAAVAGGLSIFAGIAVPLAPVAGALIDRLGSRRMAIPGLILTAAMFAAFSTATGSVPNWLLLWVLYALAAVSIKTPVWTTAVTSMFSSGRGMALGVTLCGTAIAQIFSPVLAQWLIATQGWRAAYVWLAAGWGAAALIPTLLFFFDARDRQRLQVSSDAKKAVVLSGLNLRQAMRNPAMLKVAASTLLTNCVVGGFMVHQVPLLKEHGLAPAMAAMAAGASGITSLVGKLLSGWVLDRMHGGVVASISLAIPALAFLMLLQGDASPWLAVAAILILGYVTGAQLQLSAYLTSRYGGLLSFGKLIGVISGLVALGIGIGPVVVGAVYDRFGSYNLMLECGIPLALLSGIMLLRLGPYPEWSSSTAHETLQDAKP